ncbi:MAG TPA: hypothetical protein VHU84_13575, partial [Lacipirellulaceae bacterium]|nr:hypothetical protein [Lacipirellulaceae bacterium]
RDILQVNLFRHDADLLLRKLASHLSVVHLVCQMQEAGEGEGDVAGLPRRLNLCDLYLEIG